MAKYGPHENSIQVESAFQPSRSTTWPMPGKSRSRGSSAAVVAAGSRGSTVSSRHRNSSTGIRQRAGSQPLFWSIQAANGSLKRWTA